MESPGSMYARLQIAVICILNGKKAAYIYDTLAKK
jgi:hypothetical protein